MTRTNREKYIRVYQSISEYTKRAAQAGARRCCDCEEVVDAMKKEGNDKANNKKKMKAKEQKQLQNNKKKKKSLVETGSNSTNGSSDLFYQLRFGKVFITIQSNLIGFSR